MRIWVIIRARDQVSEKGLMTDKNLIRQTRAIQNCQEYQQNRYVNISQNWLDRFQVENYRFVCCSYLTSKNNLKSQ